MKESIIKIHFPNSAADQVANQVSINSSSPAFVRIGSVYLQRGDFEAPWEALIHCPDTVSQLEMLAASAQSKAPVLLEGDTASRKTALVRELARLARQDLVMIPLNQDSDIGDIIGQW